MKVQQNSVDSYLEDIVIRAGERAADQEARQEIKERAAAIDRIADEMDKRFVHEFRLYSVCYQLLLPLQMTRRLATAEIARDADVGAHSLSL